MQSDQGTWDQDFTSNPREFWQRTTPVQLARLIERAPERIEFHLGEQHEFVRALAKMKQIVPPARWRRILKRLVPRAWESCDAGPARGVRVLGNGGVAVRNFHRVQSLDLDRGLSVSGLLPRQIRREVETVLRRGRKQPADCVVLMHHGPKGVIFPNPLRGDCVFNGQSVLFATSRNVQGLRVLGATGDPLDCNLAIRLFRDTVCIYETLRKGDDADTVINMFTVAHSDYGLDGVWTMELLLNAENGWPEFAEWVAEDLGQEFIHCRVPSSLRKDFRSLMTSAEPHSWAAELFAILNQFPPLFGKDPLRLPLDSIRLPSTPCRRRCSVYTFELAPTAPRVERAINTLGIEGAELVMAPDAQGVQTIRAPFRNLVVARTLAVALKKRFGPVWLTVPHLGLDHREGPGRVSEGNGAWFGFGQRDRVIALA